MATRGLLYGALAYACALASFAYAVGFIGSLVVPKTIDSGATGPVALFIDIGLVTLFALQHSVMARPGFKAVLARVLPAALERSTYVLASALLLALLCWQWQPLPALLWQVQAPPLRALLYALYAGGWLIAGAATCMISHGDLFGLRQVWAAARGMAYAPVPFARVALYRHVRHPIMLGLLIAFWAAPDMSVGRLLFAALNTAYVFIGTWFEERDLRRAFGADYEAYAREAGMLLPKRRAD
ncbi:MAG TPA: hypothetical protein VGN52_20040 [Burkholderiales bacterium]